MINKLTLMKLTKNSYALFVVESKIMKKLLRIVVLGLLLSSSAYAQNLKFTKIINLDKPWGSSFINIDELIITEKKGKIKIVNINSGEVSEVDHNLNFL